MENPTKAPAGVPRIALLAAADRAGLVSISALELSRLAGVGNNTAWRWLHGGRVAPRTEAAIRGVLGLAMPGRRRRGGSRPARAADHVAAP